MLFRSIEAKYPNPMSEDEIYGLLKKTGDLGMGYVVPQGSPMSAMGNDYKVQSLSNCFVISSPQDSYGGILYTDQQQAQIMKRRGGVGFDISTIRPSGVATALLGWILGRPLLSASRTLSRAVPANRCKGFTQLGLSQ